MSTTKLFVELVVIGAGALPWLAFLTVIVFGYQPALAEALNSAVVALALLPLVYVLGIITDRVADLFFEKAFELRRRKCRDSDSNYELARLILFERSPKAGELIDYGRHRLRIARGWSFNSLISAVLINVWLYSATELPALKYQASVFGTILFLLLSVGGWFTWRRILKEEYRVVERELQMDNNSEFRHS